MESYIKEGDCLDLMKEIPDGSVDMVLCDLPYGTTRNSWDVKIPLEPLWERYKRVIKGNGAILLFSQMPFGAELIMSNPKMFRYEWIWKKTCATGFLNANRMPLKAHENVLVYYDKLPTYNPQKWQSTPYWRMRAKSTTNYGKSDLTRTESKDGMRFPLDVVEYQNPNGGGKVHPTQKPVPLLEYLIKTYTNPGEIVLDNCMGSGSTCVAAINTDRKYIGYELDHGYFETAKARIAEAEEKHANGAESKC